MSLFFFLLFLLLALAFVGWGLAPNFFTPPERTKRWSVVLGSLLFIPMILSLGIIGIDAGHVGVVKRFGAVTGEVFQPGLTWMPPFISSVEDIDTRTRSIRIEGYTAASREQQDLFMNLTLNYHVDPAKTPEIVQTVGTDFEAKIVQPRLLDIPKSVTDDYPAAQVLNARDDIRNQATVLLRDALGPYGFVVENIALENFSYSTEYNAAIEAKQVEQQRVETEKQKLEQAKIAAQTAVEQAKGQANSQIERARGEAEANRLVSQSLTQAILTNRYIEKIAPGIQTMLVPSEGGLILDLGDTLKPAAP